MFRNLLFLCLLSSSVIGQSSTNSSKEPEAEDAPSTLKDLRDSVYTIMRDVNKVPFQSPPRPKKLTSTFEASCGLSVDDTKSHTSFPQSNHMSNSLQIINDGIVANESQFSQVSGFGLASFTEQFRSKDYDIFDSTLVIRGGLTLQFKEQPPLSPVPIPLSNTQDPQKFLLLSTEVETLLTKRAVEEVPVSSIDPGFYSRLFLVSKKTGGMRPVIDLSILNSYMIIPHFKMETNRSIRASILPGYSDSFLPGRLTDQGTFSRETLSQYRCSHQIAALSGVSHFLEKVGPHSVSGLYFPRRTLPYSSVHSSTSSGKVSESLFKNSSVSISKNSYCSPVFTTARSLEFTSGCCSTWSPSHSTSSILSTSTLAPSYTGLGISSSNHSSGIVSSFGLVDFSSKRFERPTSVRIRLYLEMKASSSFALSHFQSLLQNKSLVLATDNTTVVAYLRNQGGTHCYELYLLAREILLLCNHLHLQIVVRHVPGKLNVLADALSRTLTPVNTEWELLQSVFQAITLQWGSPHVDLFATSLNYKVQVFMSPVPDPKAYAVDCMSVPWDGMFAYAFPPFRFLSQVLRKISAEQGLIILIAPAWPKQAWFPDLLHLSCARPLVLPVRHNLLSQFKGKILHPNPEKLHLFAWLLSGIASRREVFLNAQPDISPEQSEIPLTSSMMPSGLSSVVGVVRRKLILSKFLYNN
ncbi:Hypothetical predicted protein [Mytilus galloprovincialis]|uniref:RNase H type-1 domain-containing protein n=1 Tax=Mytilus galloprovincialis TaxID=29158 RepID=A0A8B6FW85_MYTGA|nr:Hypothetical predicted protein [Mytilus galloprovincialis]